MITVADVLEIMAVVSACHHRTAPRLDDREATLVTADIWKDLFNVYGLNKADLIAAVKKRATREASAPEPAEIIQYARDIRQQRTEEESDTDREARELRNSMKVVEYDEALRQISKRTGRRAPGKEIAS